MKLTTLSLGFNVMEKCASNLGVRSNCSLDLCIYFGSPDVSTKEKKFKSCRVAQRKVLCFWNACQGSQHTTFVQVWVKWQRNVRLHIWTTLQLHTERRASRVLNVTPYTVRYLHTNVNRLSHGFGSLTFILKLVSVERFSIFGIVFRETTQPQLVNSDLASVWILDQILLWVRLECANFPLLI